MLLERRLLNVGRLLWLIKNVGWIIPWLFKKGRDRYLFMQKSSYDVATKEKGPMEAIVGNYKLHNEWQDYEDYLMRYVDDSFKQKLVLDFGCGPGRNIIKYWKRFKRIDGCDISPKTLDLALANLTANKVQGNPRLLPSTGTNTNTSIGPDTYDLVISTITLQHICSWEIRQSIFKDIYRVLFPGGRLSAQMGFGSPSPRTVPYHNDHYNATNTNRACDVEIADVSQIAGDLATIGFKQFEYWIRPVGPGDIHPNWIFFTAVK